MDPEALVMLAVAMGLAAVLYSSVGHGGASAYLAIMALAGIAPATMRPTALALNLVVSAIALTNYSRAGHFDRRLFLTVAIPAIPFAFIGGMTQLPDQFYRPVVGVILLLAAIQFAWKPNRTMSQPPRSLVLIAAGGALGLLAGLTGTGGGIFLSPLLLITGWAKPRTTAAVAAAFIFVNSLAGLAGNVSMLGELPTGLGWLALAVGAGGLIGSRLGAAVVSRAILMRLLALVLVIAGGKLLFT
ncbi:sulfite exporter TauE/SafE family protein [Allopontixanthobacter sp.]|uniref:sulfite exporter TauE/SafE family protein n=1 Tax=Allopontixanthobacter sp. TaxID=2906452 RepID=UPI002ABCF165|nr:sulfite exporter TauE/SafE family protein [Allopontixanthobacter sp.]MDZ4308143.1 sulfite exporter TauE/SafE family protein [Allopontixanthobacter sp.]